MLFCQPFREKILPNIVYFCENKWKTTRIMNFLSINNILFLKLLLIFLNIFSSLCFIALLKKFFYFFCKNQQLFFQLFNPLFFPKTDSNFKNSAIFTVQKHNKLSLSKKRPKTPFCPHSARTLLLVELFF